jgi:hypothetical protein
MNVGWIWTANLRPFAETASRLLGHTFDDLDCAAVTAGLPGTDSEHGPWFAYPLGDVQLLVAHEPGADEMVSVRLDPLADRADIMRDHHVERALEAPSASHKPPSQAGFVHRPQPSGTGASVA